MAQFNNNDKLDMKGEWQLNVRVNVDGSFTFPPLFLSYSGRVRFEDVEKGSHGGRTFKGEAIDPPIPGLKLTGETLYLRRGVQLVQMLGVRESDQYLWVFSGKHVPDPENAKKVWILGASFDVGQSMSSGPGGQGTANVFEMIKLK